MILSTTELIADLTQRTKQVLRDAQELKTHSLANLNARESSVSWSALECIEHLNRYGEFYLPEIEMKIADSGYGPEKIFKSVLLGDYFAKSMLPKDSMKKMKTFSDKDPLGSRLDMEVLVKFIDQQHKLLDLLEQTGEVSLVKTRIPTSISKWLTLKLGDAFRVIIYHNQRHIKQAKKAIKNGKV